MEKTLISVFTIIFNLLLFHLGFAQSIIKIEGRVYDKEDFQLIPKATIRILNTNYGCESDNRGYFYLENIPVGIYALEISAQGYENKKISEVRVDEDVTTKTDVSLEKKLYFLPGIEISSEKPPLGVISLETIDRKQIEKMQARNLSEVIESTGGVYLQKSGTVAGIHQVSIRGSSAEHVLVLLDGQKLNPSGNGIADLNTVPLKMVEKIEVLKGGQSALYGADALGGIINIITLPQKREEPSRFSLENHWGSWDTEILNSSFSNLFFEKFFLKFAYTYEYSKNDFKILVYDDPEKRKLLNQQGKNGDSTTTRKNAYHKASNFFLSGNYIFNPKTELRFSGQAYQAKKGIPGSYGWMVAYQNARAEDERRLLSLKLFRRFSASFFLESSLGYSNFKQHFQNDTISVFDSRYVDDIVDFSLLAHINLFQANKLKVGTQFQEDRLNQRDFLDPGKSMGKIKRSTFSFFFSDQQEFTLPKALFFKNLTLNFALRWDDLNILNDFLSPQVGLVLSKGERYRLALRANYGRSYRQPSNNALFWKGDVFAEGNPNLLPEKSEHSEAGGEVHLPWLGELSAGITYFHNLVTDLIEWQRSFDGRYYPVNVSKAKIYGHEELISWKSPKELFEVNYNNTVSIAKNRSGDRLEDGKFIPFGPRYLTNLSFRFDYRLFEALYKIRWVSERFTGPANTKKEEPYHLEDLMVGLKKKFRNMETKLKFEWNNLRDEEYKLIYRHPMPGREWGISLCLNWELNRN
jgi:vitamin B12 transporter